MRYICMLVVMSYYMGYILALSAGLTLGHCIIRYIYDDVQEREVVDPCCAVDGISKKKLLNDSVI